MTRRPAAVSVAIQPGWTQFTSAVEAKPCTRTIGSPSPFVEECDLDAVVPKALHLTARPARRSATPSSARSRLEPRGLRARGEACGERNDAR